MSVKLFFKTLAGLFGGLFITFGVLIVFLSFFGMNFIDNIDKLDVIMEEGLNEFYQENKEEVREFALEKLGGELPEEYNKENLIIACGNPQLLDEETRELLTSELCLNAQTMTNEEVRNYLLDVLIEGSISQIMEGVLPEVGSAELKKEAQDFIKSFGSLIYVTLLGIVMYLLGVLFTFASVAFRFVRGMYRVCLKTALSAITIGILFTIFKHIKPETMVGFVQKIAELNAQAAAGVGEIPPLALKVAASILIKWIRLSTDPLIKTAFIASIPFALGVIVLLFKRFKDKGEMKGKEAKPEVPETVEES